jgi:prefoldin alpha subunit
MANQGSSVNLDNMSLDELNQLKGQQEQQVQALTNQYARLRAAAARLSASDQAVLEFDPSFEGKEVMVPLTASLYVPGKIRDPTKVLIELGTGFFAEKSTKDCSDFLQRKLALVDTNSENITHAIQNSRQNLESIAGAMQGKMLEIRARQEGRKLQSVSEE